ncbi:MAG: phosphotyrosine protein phosphatase [Ignavibacterium sp.]|uniref:phosphotyrosine protein phosphatase n=1 Tax=Ignavibacterium sp. TaxID=2651167 RepID=UPI00404AE929
MFYLNLSILRKVLFVCTQNRLRSLTAEKTFSNYELVEVKSAELDLHARKHLTSDMIKSADIIFVIERVHQGNIKNKYQEELKDKKLNMPEYSR